MKRLISITLLVLSSIFLISACGESDATSPQQSPDVTPDIDIDETPPATTEPMPPGDISTIQVTYNRISWRENMEDTAIIRSTGELREYYENLKAIEINELDDELVWRLTGDQYNDAFFTGHFLMLITVPESSGSNRHELASIEENNEVLTIHIDRQLPGIGTADMVGWLIVIELSSNYSINEANVIFTDVHLEE